MTTGSALLRDNRRPGRLSTRVGTATASSEVQLKLHFPNPILTGLSILEEAKDRNVSQASRATSVRTCRNARESTRRGGEVLGAAGNAEDRVEASLHFNDNVSEWDGEERGGELRPAQQHQLLAVECTNGCYGRVLSVNMTVCTEGWLSMLACAVRNASLGRRARTGVP